MLSEDFQDFFMRASNLMEDALEEDRDIFFDYSGADKEDEYVLADSLTVYGRQFPIIPLPVDDLASGMFLHSAH